MVSVARRTTPKAERGQTMLVMVIGLLVLAVGMYTTYSIGRTVYAKVKLQNAADAVAYSTAVREARALNFAAFANRMQIAQYVQLMEMQAQLSRDLFELTRDLYWLDVVKSIGGNGVGKILMGTLETQLEGAYIANLSKAMTSEGLLIAKGAQAQGYSTAITAMSAALVASALAQAAAGDPDIAEANDRDARGNEITAALNVINAARFANAFDPGSIAPELVPGATRSQRLITEITNASRYGIPNPAEIVGRTVNANMPGVLAGLTKIPIVGPKLDKAFNVMNGGIGTSKMLAADTGDSAALMNETSAAEPDHSLVNPGRAMFSKDTTPMMASTGMVSVVTSGQGGRLCYLQRERIQKFGQHIDTLISAEPFKDAGPNYCRDQPLLRFGGIPRYFGYNAPRGGLNLGDFNQPEVWTLLTKSPERLALPVIGDMLFDIRRAGLNAKFDGRSAGTLGGMSALSRAQVYYHRPGAWREPPNLFNPYWGARLASKSDALAGLLGDSGLSGAVAQLLADNVTMF